MNISYVSSSWIPSKYANSVNVMKMCQGFSRLGHRVELHAPRSEGAETDLEIFTYYGISDRFILRKHVAPGYPSTPGRIIYALGCARGLWKAAPHLVYGRDWPALLMAANLGLGVILELHAPAPESGTKGSLFKWLVQSKRLIRLVVNSENLQNNVADSFPEVRERLVLARNGADPVRPDDSQPPPITRRDKRMTVGYIGHLYPGRGMEILGDFARRCDWSDFHVVGGWPDDVALWKDRLKDEPNIFFHGHVAPSEVPRYLRALDVLIAPYQPVVTLHGGVGDNSQWVCPFKLFDYMAAGKPIICSDHPVIRETVEHEQDALICAPTDLGAWAVALTRLRDNPEFAAVIARNALDKFTGRYSWEARAERVLDGLSFAATPATDSSRSRYPNGNGSQARRGPPS